MTNGISADWLVEQFPELDLIADPVNPTAAELRFLLKAQGDARLGLVRGGAGERGLDPALDTYWSAIKAEFRKLVCTEDPAYADIRKLLTERGRATDATIVASVTAAIAAVLGPAIAALVPLVAVCLYALAKMGQRAFCSLAPQPGGGADP